MIKKTIIALVGIAALVAVIGWHSQVVSADTDKALRGWAWSSNIGWISVSSTNPNAGTGGTYGVTLRADNTFSGYGWSPSIGWVNFNPVGPYPETPSQAARLNTANNKVEGWIRALAPIGNPNAGGWDGWIKLSGTAQNGGAYGVSSTTVASQAKLSGYAWGDVVVGWIDFSQVFIGGVTPPPNCGNNGIDDDGDGLIDEADDCGGGINGEVCDNNIDDDGDGLIDENCPNSPQLLVKIDGAPGGSVNVPGLAACTRNASEATTTCSYRLRGTIAPVASQNLFAYWYGDCSSSSPSGCSVTMTAPRTVIAHYAEGTLPGAGIFSFSAPSGDMVVNEPLSGVYHPCPAPLSSGGAEEHCSTARTVTVRTTSVTPISVSLAPVTPLPGQLASSPIGTAAPVLLLCDNSNSWNCSSTGKTVTVSSATPITVRFLMRFADRGLPNDPAANAVSVYTGTYTLQLRGASGADIKTTPLRLRYTDQANNGR